MQIARFGLCTLLLTCQLIQREAQEGLRAFCAAPLSVHFGPMLSSRLRSITHSKDRREAVLD